MTMHAPLAQPIRGHVSHDGRLIQADDALQSLHHRAGGVEGGMLAIPGLAALASLTNRLKMRLSRAVKVADGSEDLELWVEAVPAEEIAELSILSWRVVAAYSADDGLRAVHFDMAEEQLSLIFDASLRLVSVFGEVAGQLGPGDFGRPAETIIAKLSSDESVAAQIIDAMIAEEQFGPIAMASNASRPLSMSGKPQYAVTGKLTGYRWDVLDTDDAQPKRAEVQSSGALFGRQLAPVLRQPLGRIIANAETIGSELNGPIRENYAVYAKDIANAARHLVDLVEDLGDLEAVERDDFTTAPDRIELGDVARRVAGLLALKAADHSIRIVTPTENQLVSAVAEFRRVLQIILNLVTNAIRYAPDGTEIFIDIAANNGDAYVMVSDQGNGIAMEKRDTAFEKFERLGRSGDGGSGLGLYISRRLARAMGGDLTVDDAASGGAKFTLRLPTGN